MQQEYAGIVWEVHSYIRDHHGEKLNSKPFATFHDWVADTKQVKVHVQRVFGCRQWRLHKYTRSQFVVSEGCIFSKSGFKSQSFWARTAKTFTLP